MACVRIEEHFKLRVIAGKDFAKVSVVRPFGSVSFLPHCALFSPLFCYVRTSSVKGRLHSFTLWLVLISVPVPV